MPPITLSLGIGEIPPLKRRNHGNWRPAPEGNTSFTCWVWFQYVQQLSKWLPLKLGTSPRKHIAEMKDFMFGLCLELHLTPVGISVFCHCRCTLWTPPQQWPIVRSSRWFSEMPRAQQRPSRPRYGPWQSVAKPTNKSVFWAKLSDVALNCGNPNYKPAPIGDDHWLTMAYGLPHSFPKWTAGNPTSHSPDLKLDLNDHHRPEVLEESCRRYHWWRPPSCRPSKEIAPSPANMEGLAWTNQSNWQQQQPLKGLIRIT